MKKVRTRFAPSPTGSLHLGSARTALYNWLFARHAGGTFILRIEDTDLERSTPESVQAIFNAMHWLGLEHDEGPFYQTQRFDRYKSIIDVWLREGKAYRCTCSKERLDALRAEQMAAKQKPKYDGLCRDRDLSGELKEPYVVRFKMPLTGQTVVNDLIHGQVTFENQELDDLIVLRSDGSPTYNFTVSVDDADMQITHVIRGDDHLNNTPKQIQMLQALGADIPEYVHLTMILGPDGKKLSKRHGAVDVGEYQKQGFLPQALLNTLVRLGWSHGDQEIFSIDELVRYFDLTHLSASAAALNTEKSLWLNQHYLKTLSFEEIEPHLMAYLKGRGEDYWGGDRLPALRAVYESQRERIKTVEEFYEKSRFFYHDLIPDHFPIPIQESFLTPARLPVLEKAHQFFTALPAWDLEPLHGVLKALSEELNVKLGEVAQPLRAVVTFGTVSPPLDQTLHVLGRPATLSRLSQAVEWIQARIA